MTAITKPNIAQRFRGFLPVVVDVETGGFNSEKDALLQIGAVILDMDGIGRVYPHQSLTLNVIPFEGANMEASSLAFNGIDPYHPDRNALPETEALRDLLRTVRQAVSNAMCTRAILVGHNPGFDLAFLKAACQRCGVGNNPFHPFSTFDTATLGGLAYGQTVLSRALAAAGIHWSEAEAHSALYDAQRTAELFCNIVNLWGPSLAPASSLHRKNGS